MERRGSYQQRLVKEKGLPPSRLMLQQAAVTPGEEAAVQARVHLPTTQTGDWSIATHAKGA